MRAASTRGTVVTRRPPFPSPAGSESVAPRMGHRGAKTCRCPEARMDHGRFMPRAAPQPPTIVGSHGAVTTGPPGGSSRDKRIRRHDGVRSTRFHRIRSSSTRRAHHDAQRRARWFARHSACEVGHAQCAVRRHDAKRSRVTPRRAEYSTRTARPYACVFCSPYTGRRVTMKNVHTTAHALKPSKYVRYDVLAWNNSWYSSDLHAVYDSTDRWHAAVASHANPGSTPRRRSWGTERSTDGRSHPIKKIGPTWPRCKAHHHSQACRTRGPPEIPSVWFRGARAGAITL